ncbi:cardiolipin synthase B [Wenzhouxiangella sp. AB-CW3]|uniref:phospholipase D-like domain-containing protein n=1 Tax=Wenzhouxiangella sp. AB-CW3 TaxID=2771012 RepID=UPI00168B9365|nr:phospholipase D-like domain-containing protein [Wenzhouxiangella sp. AB-CW3]QOC21344.1 cardiolipin synthase B [Wenzhouxiangella sp. AB-CW3]
MTRKTRKWLIISASAAVLVTALSFLLFFNAVPEPMRVAEPLADVPAVDSEEFRHLQTVTLGGAVVAGNRIEIFENGEEIYPAKLEAIENATRSITFETYEYWGEEIGADFAEALASAAERGVSVHAIFDYIGSIQASRDKFDRMEDAGVEVVRWRRPSWYQLSRFNHRTHRKLLVVDGEVGFTGGANVADPWQGHPDDGGYRENHYRFEGPVVAHLQNAFMQNWLNARKKLLYGSEYFPLLENAGELEVQVVNSSPSEGTHRIRLMLLLAFAGARDNIRLATPYFYPDDMIMDALLDATERGVEVDILLPTAEHYSTAVREASRNRWGKLLEANVRIHEYQPSKYHAKLYIVDDYWVSIGSSNLDNRSFRLNDETNAIIMDRELAGTLASQFDRDLERTEGYDLERWEDRAWTRRFLGWLTMTIGWHL